MNPARPFGSEVESWIFEAQLIYWLAQITGALVAALLYENLFIRRDVEPLTHGTLKPAATRRAAADA